jgi:hypothetical protein
MINKIEVGKTYINKHGLQRTVLFIGEYEVFYKYKNSDGSEYENSWIIEDFKKDHSELPKEKRKFWLWDYKTGYGRWKRTLIFCDESFKDTRGIEHSLLSHAKEKRKVESSLLEIE